MPNSTDVLPVERRAVLALLRRLYPHASINGASIHAPAELAGGDDELRDYLEATLSFMEAAHRS